MPYISLFHAFSSPPSAGFKWLTLVIFLLFFTSHPPFTAAADKNQFELPKPIKANFNSILNNKSEEVKVYDYEGRRNIFLFDFPSLTDQGRMFNRIVALIERIGAPRSRVLSNEELSQLIRTLGRTEATLAYGNDFLISELVIFFNLAELGGIELNEHELALQQYIINQKLIRMRTGFFQSIQPNAVILSIPQVSRDPSLINLVTELARRTILAHELSHAEYYTNPIYTNYVRHFWGNILDNTERDAFRRFLERGGYNPDNKEMMINEMQAYLMHTPDPRAFNAETLGLAENRIATLQNKFKQGYPHMFYPN
jgi:hypothetical protein